VAENEDTGELVGFADAWFYKEHNARADIGYVEVAKELIGTDLREGLLSRIILWLRKKGAKDIRARVHIGYRNEDDLFEGLGFEVESTATVWRRPTSI